MAPSTDDKKPFKLLGVDFTSDNCLMRSLGYGVGAAFAIGCAYHLVSKRNNGLLNVEEHIFK